MRTSHNIPAPCSAHPGEFFPLSAPLTVRLRELETEGLVRRTVIPGPPVRVSYELTEAGESLKPVIDSLGRWADRWVKV